MSGHYGYIQERIQQHCLKCDFWDNYNCSKGHVNTSPTGCPIRKFEPVYSAGYDPDRPAQELSKEGMPSTKDCKTCNNAPKEEPKEETGGCQCAQGKGPFKRIKRFISAMKRWRWFGYPVTPKDKRDERWSICKQCPEKGLLTCKSCGCFLALKIPIRSEFCPKKKWPEVWTATERKAFRREAAKKQRS